MAIDNGGADRPDPHESVLPRDHEFLQFEHSLNPYGATEDTYKRTDAFYCNVINLISPRLGHGAAPDELIPETLTSVGQFIQEELAAEHQDPQFLKIVAALAKDMDLDRFPPETSAWYQARKQISQIIKDSTTTAGVTLPAEDPAHPLDVFEACEAWRSIIDDGLGLGENDASNLRNDGPAAIVGQRLAQEMQDGFDFRVAPERTFLSRAMMLLAPGQERASWSTNDRLVRELAESFADFLDEIDELGHLPPAIDNDPKAQHKGLSLFDVLGKIDDDGRSPLDRAIDARDDVLAHLRFLSPSDTDPDSDPAHDAPSADSVDSLHALWTASASTILTEDSWLTRWNERRRQQRTDLVADQLSGSELYLPDDRADVIERICGLYLDLVSQDDPQP